MSDFKIRVSSELDTTGIESKLKELANRKMKIPVDFDIKDSSLKKFVENIGKVKLQVDNSGIKGATNEVNKLSQAQRQLSNFKFKMDTSGVKSEVTQLGAQLEKLKGQLGNNSEQKKQFDSIKNSYNDLLKLQSSLQKKSFEGSLNNADIEKYNSSLKKAQNEAKILKNELSQMTTVTERMNFSSKMKTWLENNTKATKEARAEVETYIKQIEAAGNSLGKGEFNQLQNSFKKVSAEMQLSGNVGKSWFSELKRGFAQIGQFVGVYGILHEGVQITKAMANAVLEVNSSMVELRKVSTASDSSINAYFDEASVSAKKYGASISDVINSTADWSRLGYSLDEAKKLSDATTLMQKVGDNMTQETSSQGIISTLKGFGMQADEVNKIIDKVNEVANSQPIDTSGIFEGLSRSASSMSAANNTLEQTISLITAANSVVQDPASVGTAFKTKLIKNCLYVQKCA